MQGWHDFFVLIGTVSAMLVGLMSVAVAITANATTDELRPGQQAFITPTMVYFASALVIALLVLIPVSSSSTTGIFVAVIAALGLLYALGALYHIRRHNLGNQIDELDWLFYGLSPIVAQFVLVLGALLVIGHKAEGPYIVATALILVIVLALRNAWDMTVWAVIQAPKK